MLQSVRRAFPAFLAFLAIVGVAVGLAPGAWQGTMPGAFFRGDSSDVPRAVAPSDPLPAEGRDYADDFEFYTVTLATDSVTWLSSVCSFTPPCDIVFQAADDYCPGPATTTVATVQKNSRLISGGSAHRWAVAPLSALYDLGFTGSTATASELSITVVPRGRIQ